MPNLRVFLVEDDPGIRETIIPAMSELSHAVVVAFADREDTALEWLQEHHSEIDCVVLDMFLIQGNGLGVLAGLKAHNIQLPVVVLTNHATEDMRRRSMSAGAQEFFDKVRETDQFFEFLLGLQTHER